MTKDFSPKRGFAVHCPTCGAGRGEKCELTSGQPRTDPHRERPVTARLKPIERRKIKMKVIECVASTGAATRSFHRGMAEAGQSDSGPDQHCTQRC
jgi:hypothetical protein